MQIVLPCEDQELRIETSNRQFFRISRHETLPLQMELALVNLIQQELLVFKMMERLTFDVERRPDFTALALFRCIDRGNHGCIDEVNLAQFFKNNGIFLHERELAAIIRRIDTSGDQTITYEELNDFLKV